MAERGRILGLDLGDARIGVAITDDRGRLAVPIGTVRTGAPADVKAIVEIVRDREVARVVVGHPLLLSGDAGERAHLAEQFADALRSVLPVPVELHDERLSTVEADRALRAAGVSGREVRRTVDASAAAVILQAYLDARA